jgi:hypothetical protein
MRVACQPALMSRLLFDLFGVGRVFRAIRRDHLCVLCDCLRPTPAVRGRGIRIRHGPRLLRRPAAARERERDHDTDGTHHFCVVHVGRWCNTRAARVSSQFAAWHSCACRELPRSSAGRGRAVSAGARTFGDGGDADRSQEGQGKVCLHQRREHRAADAPRRAIEVNPPTSLSAVTVCAASRHGVLRVDCSDAGAGVGHRIMQSKRRSS